MPVMFQDWIVREDLKRNQSRTGRYLDSDASTVYRRYYLFGDNTKREGYGGQAKSMRGEDNAIGIATKYGPSMRDSDMWIERKSQDFLTFKNIIDKDLEPVYKILEQGGIVVIPTDGLGTGLSKLPENAPRTNDYLNDLLFNVLPAQYGVHKSNKWEDNLPPPSVENKILIFCTPESSLEKPFKVECLGRAYVLGYVGRLAMSYYHESGGTEIMEWVEYDYPNHCGFWVGHMYDTLAEDGYMNPKKWREATKQDFEEMGFTPPPEFKG